jgi:hypothetical protein
MYDGPWFQWGTVYASASGAGHADARLITPPGLYLTQPPATWQLNTSANYVGTTDSVVGIEEGGGVTAVSSVQDMLTLSNANPSLVGGTVQLNFVATIFDQVMTTNVNLQEEATTTLTAYIGPGDYTTARTDLYTNVNTGQSDHFSTSGWDTLQSLGGGYYSGTFHVDAPIVSGEAIAGEIPYTLQDTSVASGYVGTAMAGDPWGFSSVTLPDVGNVTPESLGVSVTFASGISSPNLLPSVASSVWATAVSGSWSNSGNWTNGVPKADGATAAINVSTTAAVTIALDEPVTLGTLLLGSGTSGVGYTLCGAGSNTLTFSNTSNGIPALISVTDGMHAINAPVVLASNLVVTSPSSNPWTLTFGTASSITDMPDPIIPFDQATRKERFAEAFDSLKDFVAKWESLRHLGAAELRRRFRRTSAEGYNERL